MIFLKKVSESCENCKDKLISTGFRYFSNYCHLYWASKKAELNSMNLEEISNFVYAESCCSICAFEKNSLFLH